MTKAELINQIAEKSELTKKDAEKAFSAVVSTITEALVNGDKVQIVGFGTFEVRDRKEKQSKNPQTGETITVPAKKAPAFKAGKALKDAVNA
ncbi:MAG: HU family DNA-binding protein [Oscillospiraceae bacterium]|jgi:DNA-binding protein HU-beta|nr:HU family DNA-binding protein [Oscillospiraceae bacterium]